jgi:hypothetical protein
VDLGTVLRYGVCPGTVHRYGVKACGRFLVCHVSCFLALLSLSLCNAGYYRFHGGGGVRV